MKIFFDDYVNVVQHCKLDTMEMLKDMEKKDLDMLQKGCKGNISFDNALNNIDKIDILLIMQNRNISINWNNVMIKNRETLLKAYVDQIINKSLPLYELKKDIEYLDENDRKIIIDYYNEKK